MELALHRPLFFDPHAATRGEKKSATDAGSEAGKDKRLFCAACRHPITHQDQRIPVSGSHEHTCTNPAGYTFRIGCFHDAGGCLAAGESTMEHTWFKGYSWQVVLCASCERHIGWRFQASADYFHGLIVDRLSSVAGARS
jgi:hypothetical protein